MYANLLLPPPPNKTFVLFQAEGERFPNGVSFVSVNVSLRQQALRLIERCQCLITHVSPRRRNAGIPSHLQRLCKAERSVAAGASCTPVRDVQSSCCLLVNCLLQWVVLAQGDDPEVLDLMSEQPLQGHWLLPCTESG